MSIASRTKEHAEAIIAVGIVLGMVLVPAKIVMNETIAQEVEKRVAPVTDYMKKHLQLEREAEIRERWKFCMERATGYPEGRQRERRCNAESDYQWLVWMYQDCVDLRGEENCDRPEPLPPREEPQ